MILYYQTKSGCKPTSSLADTTEIVIFWLYKPSLWPWRWTQWTTFSAWHSGLWRCITIPGLATKCSVVQKILSRQTFTKILNLRCDLEHNSPVVPQGTPPYDAVLPNQAWLQRDQQFRRYERKSYFDYISPHCDLDFEHNEPIFLHDTLAYYMHDHTRFGDKMFCDSEDIVWTNIH